jgi:hypothetical protein
MTLNSAVIKNIIRKLLSGQDFSSEVLARIDVEFLDHVVDFFKQIVKAKLNEETLPIDWYKEEFLRTNSLFGEEIGIYPNISMTTLSKNEQIVLNTILNHCDELSDAFNSFDEEDNYDMTFRVKFRGVGFGLELNESLMFFNTLALKRSVVRDRLWNETGKQVEKPLMITLCALFQVPIKCFDQKNLPESERESDFYLFDETGKDYPCEVKLMGKGNPESADAVFARGSSVLVANKLSDTNKQQMDKDGILWVELQTNDGYKRFEQVLKALSIPCKPFTGNLEEALEKILSLILSDDVQDSVTPEVVLQESLFNDNSDSELLIEFE